MFAKAQTLAPTCTTGARRAPSFFSRLRAAMALSKQRRSLADLDDALLKDIGLTREEALREAERPLWDAPRHWMR